MIIAKDLKAWIDKLDDQDKIAIGKEGLHLVLLHSNNEQSDECIEIGVAPAEEQSTTQS